jgi:hypothetical protein
VTGGLKGRQGEPDTLHSPKVLEIKPEAKMTGVLYNNVSGLVTNFLFCLTVLVCLAGK